MFIILERKRERRQGRRRRKQSFFFKDFIDLFKREAERAGARGGAEGEVDSLWSREPNLRLDRRTLGS